MNDYTIKELEQIVQNCSACYRDSEAFQIALYYIKESSTCAYKELLYKEARNCGGLE